MANQPGLEVDHSFPFHKSKWICASAPPIRLRDVYRCNLTFCLQVEFSSVLMQLVVYLSCKNTCPLLSLLFLPFDKLYLLLMKEDGGEKVILLNGGSRTKLSPFLTHEIFSEA